VGIAPHYNLARDTSLVDIDRLSDPNFQSLVLFPATVLIVSALAGSARVIPLFHGKILRRVENVAPACRANAIALKDMKSLILPYHRIENNYSMTCCVAGPKGRLRRHRRNGLALTLS
jgi:hypothetical protein